MNAAIFVGPSLDKAAAAEQITATILPPIRRGDLPRAVADGFDVIAIIDGEFNQSLAVSVMEIRAALNQGARIWGSSSMGALRAVECRRLGMKGVGWIYERYEDGTFTADDEVTLLYDPRSGRAMSLPLVNVRWAAELAALDHAPELVEIARSVPFAERTAETMLAAAKNSKHYADMEKLMNFMTNNPLRCDRKRLDALHLLECLCHSV